MEMKNFFGGGIFWSRRSEVQKNLDRPGNRKQNIFYGRPPNTDMLYEGLMDDRQIPLTSERE